MTLHHPMSSSSHWRIPAPSHSAPAAAERTLRATLTRRVARTAPLARQATRRATRQATRAVTVGLLVGGVLVAPALALLALVSLMAPLSAVMRQLAPALIFIALLWLTLAIFGAHIHMRQMERSQAQRATPRAPHD